MLASTRNHSYFSGHQRAACATEEVLEGRGCASTGVGARVCREARARVSLIFRVSDTDLPD